MKLEDTNLKLSTIEAMFILSCVLLMIGTGIIYYGMNPHLPIIGAILLLFVYGGCKGLSFRVMEKALIQGAISGLGAIYIFFFIGLLIAGWIVSGTIPTMMYYGFELISDQSFYAVTFLVTSLLGLCIGSSLTTAATLGVAFIGMASAYGLSLPITAGAIISGAFLGDKMSPLSDTTNLASETVGVSLFVHIKNMLWTTIPGFVISFTIFYFLSPNVAIGKDTEITTLIQALEKHTFISLWSLLPFIIVGILALKKTAAIPTIAAGIISSVVIAFIGHPELTITEIGTILFSGYVMDSGVEQLDTILTAGGLESMMFSISLVLLALGMGGLLFGLGIIPSLLQSIAAKLNSTARLVSATVMTGIGVNFLVGEQYLSVLLPGNAYRESYDKLGLDAKSLSRTLEDSGTVVNPLVPWGVCGVFLTQVLGVSTLDYAPFAFFCLLCPLLSLISGFTKIGLHTKA